MKRGDRLRLTIERPAAGGRMIARHDGAIVFVSGVIPGEVVEAEIEKVQRGTVWAVARQIVEPSADRVADSTDRDCGGAVFAHIRYDRQREIKAAIVADAFRRLGRLVLDVPVDVAASPIDGYRMRARLHVRANRIGFFREGTHTLCDAGPTGQLRTDTLAVITALQQRIAAADAPIGEIEISENIDASERACHFELLANADPSLLAPLLNVDGLTGATCAPADHARATELWGSPFVTDRLHDVSLRRHVRSFFQGNRYLLPSLVEHVVSHVSEGAVLDLYAGVGLFSVAAAAAGRGPVTAVEGDRFSAVDLRHNAAFVDVQVAADSVEHYLAEQPATVETVIVDPPRTGMSKEAIAGVLAVNAPRIVYVSCDVATLARDTRVLLDAGYTIRSLRAFDLFPNTAHVETVIAFAR